MGRRVPPARQSFYTIRQICKIAGAHGLPLPSDDKPSGRITQSGEHRWLGRYATEHRTRPRGRSTFVFS